MNMTNEQLQDEANRAINELQERGYLTLLDHLPPIQEFRLEAVYKIFLSSRKSVPFLICVMTSWILSEDCDPEDIGEELRNIWKTKSI